MMDEHFLPSTSLVDQTTDISELFAQLTKESGMKCFIFVKSAKSQTTSDPFFKHFTNWKLEALVASHNKNGDNTIKHYFKWNNRWDFYQSFSLRGNLWSRILDGRRSTERRKKPCHCHKRQSQGSETLQRIQFLNILTNSKMKIKIFHDENTNWMLQLSVFFWKVRFFGYLSDQNQFWPPSIFRNKNSKRDKVKVS